MGFNKKSNGKVELIPNAVLTGISEGSAPKDAVNYAQVFSSNSTTTGNNTHTGTETFSNATGVTTNTVTERTAGSGVTVDSVLLKDGGVSNSGATAFAGFFFTAAQNNITAGTGGAISVANYLTTINTDAGGDAFTIAAGTIPGQMKKVLLVADGGGDATITLTGYTSIVMNDANDYVILIWSGAAWFVVENSGCTVNA